MVAEPVETTGASTGSATLGQPPSSLPETANITRNLSLSRKWLLLLVIFIGNSYFRNMKKNKLLQIKRRFSRIDLFLKKECAGGT